MILNRFGQPIGIIDTNCLASHVLANLQFAEIFHGSLHSID